MEKHVVSRELAKQLEAAGYQQSNDGRPTCYFVWDTWMEGEWEVRAAKDCYGSHIVAPLSDELLEQLPPTYTIKDTHCNLFMERIHNALDVKIMQLGTDIIWVDFAREKPADALAELWLWCKENGHVE